MFESSPGPRQNCRKLIRAATGLFAAATMFVIAEPSAAQGSDCLDTECFFSSRVRDFQIIDTDTFVIYVGQDRCAFVVEVDGLFCDVTFLPEVEFIRSRNLTLQERTDRPTTRTNTLIRNERICANNASAYAIATFGFTAFEDETPRGRPACELRTISPASDHALMELLALEGIAPPPPPIGNGEIARRPPEGQAPEQAQEPAPQ